MKTRFVILIMKEWRERAFLRAQLMEEGIRTLAVETAAEAEEWILGQKVIPLMIFYDQKSQDDISEDIERIGSLVPFTPILVLTRTGGGAEGRGYKETNLMHVIKRPISIGDIVEKIKEALRNGLI